MNGQLELIKWMSYHGVSPGVYWHRPWIVAMERGHWDTVEWIFNYCHPPVDFEKIAAVNYLMEHKNFTAIDWLMDHDVIPQDFFRGGKPAIDNIVWRFLENTYHDDTSVGYGADMFCQVTDIYQAMKAIG